MSIESSMLSIDMSRSAAAAKGGIFNALIGLGVRVFEADEMLRSCLSALVK